jgi:hypothetical protein
MTHCLRQPPSPHPLIFSSHEYLVSSPLHSKHKPVTEASHATLCSHPLTPTYQQIPRPESQRAQKSTRLPRSTQYLPFHPPRNQIHCRHRHDPSPLNPRVKLSHTYPSRPLLGRNRDLPSPQPQAKTHPNALPNLMHEFRASPTLSPCLPIHLGKAL